MIKNNSNFGPHILDRFNKPPGPTAMYERANWSYIDLPEGTSLVCGFQKEAFPPRQGAFPLVDEAGPFIYFTDSELALLN